MTVSAESVRPGGKPRCGLDGPWTGENGDELCKLLPGLSGCKASPPEDGLEEPEKLSALEESGAASCAGSRSELMMSA